MALNPSADSGFCIIVGKSCSPSEVKENVITVIEMKLLI
jgi:hypothetical protein